MASTPCPCGRTLSVHPLPWADCCGRYLDAPSFAQSLPAPDAETLMRSRYSAFVRGDTAYLRATWHVSTCPQEVLADAGTRWLGLTVRAHRVIDADHAEVEFIARYRAGGAGPASGRAVRLHERSRFVRENDRWYYVDGDALQ